MGYDMAMAQSVSSTPRGFPTVPTPAASATGRVRRAAPRSSPVLRTVLTIAGVVVVGLLAALMAYRAYESDRRVASLLNNDPIREVGRRVGSQVRLYFNPAQQFLELADAVVGDRSVLDAGAEISRVAERMLADTPSVAAFTYADPDGNALYLMRNAFGSFDIKRVDTRAQKVVWTRRDSAGRERVEEGRFDGIDPRTQAWYQGAKDSKKPFWTDTYILPALQKPGVTFAMPQISDKGGLKTVMAVDVELASLSAILKDRENIGPRGMALIVDRTGEVVAYPADDWLLKEGATSRAPMLYEMGDPVLTRVYDLVRLGNFERKVLDFGNRRIVVLALPMRRLTAGEWQILVIVPASDVGGFVSDSGVVELVMSIVAVLIVAGIAGVLAWRNIRVERRAAAAATRQQAVELRLQSFVDFTRDAASPGDAGETLKAATESAVRACAAKRVAVWRLGPDGRTLSCDDCFDRTANDHTSGLELHRDELPNLFAALATGQPIQAVATGRDRRAAELFASYLSPLEISRVYIQPLGPEGDPVGMLTIEDPPQGDRGAGLATYCNALALLLALRLRTAAVPVAAGDGDGIFPRAAPAAPPAPVEAPPPDSLTQRHILLERTLIRLGSSLEALGDSAVDTAAVGVVRLPDWATVVQPPAEGGASTAMDAIVFELRRVIETSGVDYAALLGDQIVLAALAREKDAAAENAQCIAAAMLELRDCLVGLETKWGTTIDFRLAIDVGMVVNSAVGADPSSRNLWGASVGIAKVLADTAAMRTIAASETAYALLSGTFLFRPRGSYFMPETGNMRTFVMVGRL